MISFVCAAVAGVQVFNLTKSLPVEPYSESGPKLLTRNTTRRAWKATFELMKNNTKRVAMLGVPGIGKSRNLALGLWHLVTGQLPGGIPQPEAKLGRAERSSFSPRARVASGRLRASRCEHGMLPPARTCKTPRTGT